MVQIMPRTIQPLGTKVALEKVQIQPSMVNGIHIGDQTHRSNLYKVVAVGKDTVELLPEMLVFCDRGEGELGRLGSRTIRVVEEKNILAIQTYLNETD